VVFLRTGVDTEIRQPYVFFFYLASTYNIATESSTSTNESISCTFNTLLQWSITVSTIGQTILSFGCSVYDFKDAGIKSGDVIFETSQLQNDYRIYTGIECRWCY
jgi:hypothetical protein